MFINCLVLFVSLGASLSLNHSHFYNLDQCFEVFGQYIFHFMFKFKGYYTLLCDCENFVDLRSQLY